MALLNISGEDLPSPTQYAVVLSDADSANTTRSEAAVMNRERIRANMLKISAAWEKLDTAEMSRILSLVTPAEFTVQYFFGSPRTAKMYAGDRNIELVYLDGGTAAWNVNFNLVEY